MDVWQIIVAVLMGVSLAATCGLRAFLPLLIISICAKAGFVDLASGFEWMGSWTAIICFGVATVAEILADKIPAVDHVLDAAGVYVRPIAGAVAASSLISGMDPLLGLVIGIIIGGTIAGTVQAIKGSIRMLSTGATGGLGNPVISVIEDGATAVIGVAGLIVPALTGLAIIVLIIFFARKLLRRIGKRDAGTKEVESEIPIAEL